MGLLETLAFSLGPAIAKAILKSWLKDSAVARDVTSALVDMLRQRTVDILAVQQGRRQFEEIGERVAASLQPLFAEAAIDNSGKEAVALAVSVTIENAPLGPQFLVEGDLDPTKLARHLLDSRPDATRDFSSAESALYARILTEVAEYVADIAAQLPAFTERTFAEVLKRESALLSRAEQILDEVRRIREESIQANPQALAARFEAEYRRSVIRRLDQVELFGADVSYASRRHRLSVAYVTLSAQLGVSEVASESPASGQPRESEDMRSEDDDVVTILVHEVLDRSRRLLVRGPAGCGKTTLLKWVAVKSASRAFTASLGDWNNTIPFFIRLRQYVDSGPPPPEEFPSSVAPTIAGTMPSGWVHEQLRSGRAVVLVDGVDEVSQSQRSDVRDWLQDLVQTFENSRFIVSSRPHAAHEGWMESEGFDEAELQPMGLPDIDQFIDHWHSAVREVLQDPDEIGSLEELAANLKLEIRRRRPIRTLATNPMLCSMICALHRDRRQQLPSDRIEIYEACCQMLLERRDVERRVSLGEYPRLSYRQKRALLEDLAYWMLSNGYATVAVEQADDRFDRKLANMLGLGDEVTGARVRRLLVERGGLIREPIERHVDFTHRTFQEFLAARAAVDEADIGVLVRNAHDDQWREVIILAAGLAGRAARREIIGSLLAGGDEEPDARHQLHLLAVACLETSTELEPTLQVALEERLKDLVPPTNMTEAKALSSAGELAIPFLIGGRHNRATTAAACVRALSLIGGESALTALADYGEDSRITVTRELLRAWSLFDENEFGTRVLGERAKIQSLRLSDLPSREALQHLPRVQAISVYYPEALADLGTLLGLRNLTEFSGWGHGEVDLDTLSQLRSLTSLRLDGRLSICDLGPLSDLTNLKFLAIDGLSRLNDLGPIQSLTNLESLALSDLTRLSDVSPVSSLVGLTDLRLHGLVCVTDLSSISTLTALRRLELSGLEKVSSLAWLGPLMEMAVLELSGLARVADLGPVARLSHIRHLRLIELPRVADLRPLASLVKLERLELLGLSGVADLGPVASLKDLSVLVLGDLKQVTDLTPLAELSSLISLIISGLRKGIDLAPVDRLPIEVVQDAEGSAACVVYGGRARVWKLRHQAMNAVSERLS